MGSELIIIIFLAVAVVLIAVGILVNALRSKKRKRCSYKTTAVVIDSKRMKGVGGQHQRKYGVYEYQFQGESYYKTSNAGSTSGPKIGKVVDAYVNPDNPKECIIEGWVSLLGVIILIGMGCLFIIMAVILGIVLV